MATRTYEEVEILVYPNTAIPYRQNNGFVVADVLGERMGLGEGDNSGLTIQDFNPTISIPWLNGQAPNFSSLDGVEFVRFYSDGTCQFGASAESGKKDTVSGFILQGRIAYLDCKIGSSTTDTSNFDQTWIEAQGKYKVVLPPGAPRRTRILNTSKDQTHKAQTKGKLPANRSFQVDVFLTVHTPDGQLPGFRVRWGADLSLVGRQGLKWCVERSVNGVDATWRKLDSLPPVNCEGGRYQIQVRRIAGRMVVTINGASFWFMDTQNGLSPKQSKLKVMAWPEAPLQISCVNLRAQVGTALIKYADKNDTVFTGSIVRSFKRKTNANNEAVVLQKVSGWSPAPGLATVSAFVAQGSLSYTLSLRGSAQGIDTPFVNKVLIRTEPFWQYPVAVPLNLSAATDSLVIDEAMPPIAAGAEVSLVVDRVRLNSINANWLDWVKSYNPVTIRTRSHYDDNSTGSWVSMFSGYIVKPNYTTKFNDQMMTLTCRCPIIRLQKPAAVIDHRYPPLDFLFARGVEEQGNFSIYGADCVQEILRNTLGDSAADSLNGDGNGMRYFNDHYALLSTETDAGGYLAVTGALGAQPPATNGFYFPAPFGDDAMAWIGKLAAYDHAVFYYGRPSGHTGFPCPVYGRILNILAGQPTYTIPDLKYVEGDQNKALLAAENERRPERDINRVLVWGKQPEGGAAQLLPSFRMAEARLPAGDRNSPEKSWERTLVIKSELANYPGGAEAIAMGTIAELRDRVMAFPRLEMQGQSYLTWGVKITGKTEGECPNISDTAIGLQQTFRVEKVQHTFEFDKSGGAQYKTIAWARPLSGLGW